VSIDFLMVFIICLYSKKLRWYSSRCLHTRATSLQSVYIYKSRSFVHNRFASCFNQNKRSSTMTQLMDWLSWVDWGLLILFYNLAVYKEESFRLFLLAIFTLQYTNKRLETNRLFLDRSQWIIYAIQCFLSIIQQNLSGRLTVFRFRLLVKIFICLCCR